MFGTVVAVLYTIEFEKRGLPHARVLVWQEKDDDRVVTPTFISSFVSTTGSELAGVAANAPATALTNTMEIGLAQPPRLTSPNVFHPMSQNHLDVTMASLTAPIFGKCLWGRSSAWSDVDAVAAIPRTADDTEATTAVPLCYCDAHDAASAIENRGSTSCERPREAWW